MKAKIRMTGEIVEVISYTGYDYRRKNHDTVSYIDSKGIEHENEELNYYWDLEPIEEPKADTDWQALRQQYAGIAMLGMLKQYMLYTPETTAIKALEYADALIEELKKK